MSDWGAGYVTDTAYVHDFCRAQTPAILAFAALCSGVATPGGSGGSLTWCDIGCGQGYTANLVAAANPAAQIWGVDFNPGHIANARALAGAAGLQNIEFREASFEELPSDPTLPYFDVICMHGVFSWISAENRRALVAFVRKRLKPGGLLYVSYDCMPGWAGLAPLRRIFARHFAPGPGLASPAAVERALAFEEALRAAQSAYHQMHPGAEALMRRLRATPRAYLAHEILPRDWEAFCFSEVADELASAKLVFVGSAHLSDHVPRLDFTEGQLAFLETIDDPILAETTRDMILGRQFRRDIFVKGKVPLAPASLRARALSTRFALTTPTSQFEMEFETRLGKHKFHPEAHAPLIDVLSQGPILLRDALDQAFGPGASWDKVADAIKILVGRGDLQPALPAEGEAQRAATARAFNTAVLARASEGAELFYLASPVTGGGVRVDRFTQLYLQGRRRGVDDVAAFLSQYAQGAIRDADGKIMPDEEARAALKKELARVETDVAPMLRQLGVD
jgi:SAM-dependent methyltransferase